MSCDSHPKDTKKSQQGPIVRGYDFNEDIDYDSLLKNFMKIGFQATHFAKAVEETNRMVLINSLHKVHTTASCEIICKR